MPGIYVEGRYLDAGLVDQLTDRLAQAVLAQGVVPRERIGISVDLGLNGVLLALSCIRLDIDVAFCPLREPDLVMAKWLKALGIGKILLSSPLSPFFNLLPWQRSIGELQLGYPNGNHPCPFVDSGFISILRTSGTSSLPKSALVSAKAHLASARSVVDYFALGEGDVWGLNLPLYHVSGLAILFRCLLAKADICLAIDHAELLRAIGEKRITHLSLVPLQLKRLMDDGADLTKLKAVIIGGDGLPLPLRMRARALGISLYETYGLTETASMVHVLPAHDRFLGRTLPHARIEIAHDNEILIAGDSMFSGYVDDHGRIADGNHDFFRTGDLGALDKDGHLYFRGRKSNRIICGGENIQAEEIEEILNQHPHIKRSVVVGKADEIYGCRPIAFIDWAGPPLEDDDIKSFLSGRLARFKWPQAFMAWPSGRDGLKSQRQWFTSLASRL